MHRFVWDLHYPPPEGSRPSFPIAAVYRNTARAPTGPWVLPGNYSVELTVNGRTFTQPLVVKMDPRIKFSADFLALQFELSLESWKGIRTAHTALQEIKQLREQLKERRQQAGKGPLADAINALDAKAQALEGRPSSRRGFRRRGGGGESNFGKVQGELTAILELLQEADASPTTQARVAAEHSRQSLSELANRWKELHGRDLEALNNQLREAKLLPIGKKVAMSDPSSPADLVLTNGKIWTANHAQPEVEALAIRGEHIVFAGSSAQLSSFTGPKTQTIDLQGRRVIPGFFDSHVHFLGAGLQLSRISLRDCKDEAEFGRRLKDFAAKVPPGRWLLGGDWDHDRTFGGQLPSAALLDKYVPDRPVFLRRYDGHMAVVNSKTLQLAGITSRTPDPSGGAIERQPGGQEPTGILRDNAMGLVSHLFPSASAEEIAEAVRAALAEARRFGVTSVQDMDGSDAATRRQLLRTYRQLSKSDRLTLRVNLHWPLSQWPEAARLIADEGPGDDWVHLGGVKGFADGSLGSSTAWMFEPYVHDPGTTGLAVTSPQRLRELVRDADRAGLSVAIHAIGDRANAELLDVYAKVARLNGPRERRFRIEHAQHLRPQDYGRFHEEAVIPSMQPYHVIDDGRWAEGRIGPGRCAASYAYRALLDAGANLAFGTDWPVAPLNPLLGIDAAVHRRTLDGKHPEGWFPAQRISVAEALAAYTRGSAFAAGAEKTRGSLEVGKLADMVVLSRDVLDPKEEEHLTDTTVLRTVVAGKTVYER
jgi:predicted amidohydrolase YtcJ